MSNRKAKEETLANDAPNAKQLTGEILQKLSLTKSYNLNRIFLFPIVAGSLVATVFLYHAIVAYNTQKLLDPAVLNKFGEASGLIQFGADVNHVSENGNTPLKIACKVSGIDVIEFLLEYDANVDGVPGFPTPLHAAAEYRRADVIERLISAGAQIDLADSNHHTALSQAAQTGDPDIVQQLIRHGAAADGLVPDGAPLLVCVRQIITDLEAERQAALQKTMEQNEQTEDPAPNESAETAPPPPIEDEWKPDHVAVMDLLIQNGANVDVQSEIGETPLTLVTGANAAPLVKYFVEKGADVNKETAIGSPCLLAAREENWEMVELLLDKGAVMDFKSHVGKGILPDAVMSENLDFVKFLIINGAGADLIPNQPPPADGVVSSKRIDAIMDALRLKYPRQINRMLKKVEIETNPQPKIGNFKTAYRLNGIDEYAKINEPDENLAPKKVITVALWIKRRGIPGQEEKRLPFDQYLVSRNRGNKSGFNLFVDRDRRINWSVYDGSRTFTVKAEPKHLPVDSWVHVAGTCGAGEIDLFVDGKPVGLAASGWIDCASAGNTYVGRQAWAAGGYFAGQLQNLAIYPIRVYKDGFKPTLEPVRPDDAYIHLNFSRGKLSDLQGKQTYMFP